MDYTVSDKTAIKHWAENDRPREKLITQGRVALSDAELISLIIGSGNKKESAVDLSRQVLQMASNNLQLLGKYSVQDLMKIRGIGQAKAIAIVACLELGRRRNQSKVIKSPKIVSSQDAYQIMGPFLADLCHEEFWIMALNRANGLIKSIKISQGGIAGTVVDTKVVFQKALELSSSALILCHNHPSGNVNPSKEDLNLTGRLKDAGKIMDIPVLDHIIYTDQGTTVSPIKAFCESFAEFVSFAVLFIMYD